MSLPFALTGGAGELIVVKSNQIDAYGMTSDTDVVWSTSDATVATVASIYDMRNTGLIRCIAAGSATITATAGIINTTILLTVITPGTGVAATITVETAPPRGTKTLQTQTYPKV